MLFGFDNDELSFYVGLGFELLDLGILMFLVVKCDFLPILSLHFLISLIPRHI